MLSTASTGTGGKENALELNYHELILKFTFNPSRRSPQEQRQARFAEEPKALQQKGVNPMQANVRSDILLIFALLFLCLIPSAAGVFRITELIAGVPAASENARFFDEPAPIVLHVVGSLIFCIVGAFQFSSIIRHKYTTWHRNIGKLLIPCGLVSALSGLWMAHFYPSLPYDGTSLYLVRVVASVAMAIFLCLALFEIQKRNIRAHRAWIMRGYALGVGAGTQVLTHIPWFIFPDIRSEIARTIFMAAGWGINLLVVEWILYRENRHTFISQDKTIKLYQR